MSVFRSDFAVRVQKVTKSFRVHGERNQTLKDKVIYAGRGKYKNFVALDDVSVDIPRGATVGLIGVNGSGKSTLLKVISRILYPDKGTVEVKGRVSSLLELGAGFHPDFTGEENIFLNGSLMGLSKKELAKKLDEIVDFSELGDFIREPIRGYSSGMYMRLAFSIATAVNPDILLIDEILAVGDAAFQAKCMSRLKELQQAEKTLVLVTHDSGSVERFCDTAVWLDGSKVRMEGKPQEVVRAYLSQTFIRSHEGATMSFNWNAEPVNVDLHSKEGTVVQGDDENGANGVAPVSLRQLRGTSQLGEGIVETGQGLDIKATVDVKDYTGLLVPRVSFYAEDGTSLLETDMLVDTQKSLAVERTTRVSFEFKVPHLNLMPGEYKVHVELWTDDGEPVVTSAAPIALTVVGNDGGHGYLLLEREWLTI